MAGIRIATKMNWLTHSLTAFIIGLILLSNSYLITSIPLMIFFILLSIIIDIDHLFYFLPKNKFDIKKVVKDMKSHRKTMTPGLYIFHSPEFNLLLLVFGFFNQLALLIFISNFIHITLDVVEHYNYHKNFKWAKKWSVIYSLK